MVWRAYVLPEYWRLLTFYINALLIDRQMDLDWRTAQHASLLDSPILLNYNERTNISHKMINLKKIHSYIQLLIQKGKNAPNSIAIKAVLMDLLVW